MRTLQIGAALLVASVVAGGCTEGEMPTASSDDVIGPNFASAPEVFTRTITGTGFNVCTGELDDVFVIQTIRVHSFELPDTDPVRHHFNIQIREDFETAAGFSGKGFANFNRDGTPEEFSFTITRNLNLGNDDGQRLKVHFLSHITIRNGDVVRSEVENVRLSCVGNPDG